MVIEVPSEFDPNSKMVCCGNPTIQKQIDYTITVNDELFRFPNIWASVCGTCGESYFSPEVGESISRQIFQLQHPRELEIAKMLSQ